MLIIVYFIHILSSCSLQLSSLNKETFQKLLELQWDQKLKTFSARSGYVSYRKAFGHVFKSIPSFSFSLITLALFWYQTLDYFATHAKVAYWRFQNNSYKWRCIAQWLYSKTWVVNKCCWIMELQPSWYAYSAMILFGK